MCGDCSDYKLKVLELKTKPIGLTQKAGKCLNIVKDEVKQHSLFYTKGSVSSFVMAFSKIF